jgi:hypothetical protein
MHGLPGGIARLLGNGVDMAHVAASVAGQQVFPPDNPWNTDISHFPADPHSDTLIASIGLTTGLHPDFGTLYNGAPNGIPYVIVPGTQPLVSVIFTEYGDESDPGPYPIPPDARLRAASARTATGICSSSTVTTADSTSCTTPIRTRTARGTQAPARSST